MSKRDYTNNDNVQDFYYDHHTKQTLEWATKMKNNCNFGQVMGITELCELGDQLIDPSDPDIGLSQLQHALQTSEAARKKMPGHKYDWFHLTAFIHDLGKGPLAKHLTEQENSTMQDVLWGVVGDTLPLGCDYSKHNVYPEFFKFNLDYHKYDKMGLYTEHCGFDSMVFSFGHDEYMAQILERSNTSLPQESIDIIRYHSFYPWHQHNAYQRFSSDKDLVVRNWLNIFQECDLYSKQDIPVESAQLLPYYQGLYKKYLPYGLKM